MRASRGQIRIGRTVLRRGQQLDKSIGPPDRPTAAHTNGDDCEDKADAVMSLKRGGD